MAHENYKSKNELNPNTKFMSAVSLYSIVLDFASAEVDFTHSFIGSLIHRKWEKWLQKPNCTRLNGTCVQQGEKRLSWNKARNNGDIQQREKNSLCRELRCVLLLLTLWSVHSEWSADVQFLSVFVRFVVALLPTPSENCLLFSFNFLTIKQLSQRMSILLICAALSYNHCYSVLIRICSQLCGGRWFMNRHVLFWLELREFRQFRVLVLDNMYV